VQTRNWTPVTQPVVEGLEAGNGCREKPARFLPAAFFSASTKQAKGGRFKWLEIALLSELHWSLIL
jgi:hypothetical protein